MKLFELHSVDDVVSQLKRDCQFFFKEAPRLSKDLQLWRGIGAGTGGKPLVKALKNRMPVDSSKELHDYLNKFFIDKVGWPARNGTFATWDVNHASFYGDVYAIFPIGEFKYVWSPTAYDMVEYLTVDYQPDFNSVDKQLKDLEWKESDLKLMASKYPDHELMIQVDSYYQYSRGVIQKIDWDKFYETK